MCCTHTIHSQITSAVLSVGSVMSLSMDQEHRCSSLSMADTGAARNSISSVFGPCIGMSVQKEHKEIWKGEECELVFKDHVTETASERRRTAQLGLSRDKRFSQRFFCELQE